MKCSHVGSLPTGNCVTLHDAFVFCFFFQPAINEISAHFQMLSPHQKAIIAIDPKDLFVKFIYEIGMIFDDQTSKTLESHVLVSV